MTFAQPFWFAALLIVPLFFMLKTRGYLGFSDKRLLVEKRSRLVQLLGYATPLLAVSTVVLMTVALARPQIPGDPTPRKIPGRDIVLAVDISFSMSFPFKGKLQPYETPPELAFAVPFAERRHEHKGLQYDQPKDPNQLQRVHAAQDALLRFIENRWRGKTGDRMGMIVFDVAPRYAFPITDDLRMLYRKVQFLQNNLGTGTNFGTRPPGPIDLAVEHFKESGEAKSKVLILVTDGEEDIDAGTQNRLSRLVRENGIRLYVVGIGETLARKEVGIVKFSNSVGARIFRVEDAQSLQDCFNTIDRLEKSEVTIAQLETRDDMFFFFAWAALASLGLLLFAEVIIPKR